MDVRQLFDLTGRTALITGASKGIGYALATALGAAGARVVLNARGAQALERARDTLQAVKNHLFHPVLQTPGDADITAHVDFTAVALALVGMWGFHLNGVSGALAAVTGSGRSPTWAIGRVVAVFIALGAGAPAGRAFSPVRRARMPL